MKKLMALVVMVAVTTIMVGVKTYATVYWDNTDFTVSYAEHIDNAFHMYYAPDEYAPGHCWASTEIAASEDMSVYAYNRIVGVDNIGAISTSNVVVNGFVKTDAKFLNVSYAKRTYHWGYRTFINTIRQEWDYERR